MAVTPLDAFINRPVRYPTLPVGANTLDLVFTAPAVFGDGVDWPATDREVILVRNDHAADPQTFTVISVVDQFNRTGDITTYSLAAAEIAVIIPPRAGFAPSSGATAGRIKITASSADIKVAVIQLPNSF